MIDLSTKLNKILSDYSKGNKSNSYQKLKKIAKKYHADEKIQFNLALMEEDQGLTNKAKNSYMKLIRNFNNNKAKTNLYILYIKENDYSRAIKTIEFILKDDPINTKVLLDKAYIYLKINEINKCLDLCNLIISREKENTTAINLIGCCLLEEKKYKEAEKTFLLGNSYNKKDVALLNSLGKYYFEIWKIEKAEEFYQKALKENPLSHQTLNNLGNLYLETNKSKDALTYYSKALEIVPNEATILNNLAKTYLSLNKLNEAEKYCNLALNVKKDDSFIKILSIINFRKLDFKKAWLYFDGRLGLDQFIKRNESYEMIKTKLLKNKKIDQNKKLLVIREQGVGDEILYGTVYADLLEKFSNTIIESDERLLPLFLNSFENHHHNKFVKLGNYSSNIEKLKDFDQVLYAGSLGYYFRNDYKDFPKKNYLKIQDKEIKKGEACLKIYKKKYKIGLSWKSFNNTYSNQKSLELNDFKFLIQSNDFDIINLQYGNVDNEIINFNKDNKFQIHILKNLDLFNDFIGVGSILKNIDLFVTVSNSTAHLSGALGVKTLLIKPFNQVTFHYWNQPGTKTPWYDSVELIDKSLLENTKLFEEKIYSMLN